MGNWDTLSYDIAGYWRPIQGAVIMGTIRGTQVRAAIGGGTRLLYLVELAQPCQAWAAGDEEASEFAAGDIIAVQETAAMRGLRDYVVHEGRVAIKVLAKVKLSGGRTMWKLDVKASGKKATLPAQVTMGDTSPYVPAVETDSGYTPEPEATEVEDWDSPF
jgi:hypothetical protein